jgi:phage terminase Nu1 subunit (DNA packaging protein)
MALKTFTCTAGDLAEALGLSEPQIFNLARSGVVIKTGRGQYDLARSMRNYYERQLDESVGNPQSLIEQRTRLTRYQADLALLQLQQARRDYLPLAICVSYFQRIMISIKSQLMAIPSEIGTQFPGVEREAIMEIGEIIRRALSDAASIPVDPELTGQFQRHIKTFAEEMNAEKECH